MYEFKKTDSKELEKTITILLAVLMIAMPLGHSLQLLKIIQTERMSITEVILAVGALILLMFDVAYVFRKENRKLRTLDIVAVLMLFSVVISTLLSWDMGLAMGGNDVTGENAFVIASYVITFYSASIVKDKKNKKIIYVASVILGLIQFVFTLFQTVFVLDVFEAPLAAMGARAFGTIRNPNPFASLMVVLAGIECGLFYNSKGKKQYVLHCILIIFYAFSMFASGTRGAFVGFFAAALIMSILLIIKEKKSKRSLYQAFGKLGIIIILLAVSAGLCFLPSQNSWQTVAERTSTDVQNGEFGQFRGKMWADSFERYFLKSPIFGCGPSNINFGCFTGSVEDDSFHGEIIGDVHNKYLNILNTQGVVGLLAYLILLGMCVVKCYKKFVMENQESDGSALGMILAFIGFIISDFFCIGMACMVPYFYILLGMMCGREETKCLSKK
jgi:O-antigen ligase